ncbi:hypothetical protein K488DRAFT_89126 [Vararia minispora EC-137]|uniref:Uncharacterized protein n=1 Tax=Vararia minispora EC-137 TaxID=1314806 RepID=A0ACB8QBG9_9AGAM|nr:hypothetical protein K488DRAFT_89126 [Vararia minispora EC-137]
MTATDPTQAQTAIPGDFIVVPSPAPSTDTVDSPLAAGTGSAQSTSTEVKENQASTIVPPTVAENEQADSVIARASQVLHVSSGTAMLTSRASALISIPALRARTAAHLAASAQRPFDVHLGAVSINALLARPDSAEHGLACNLLGLSAALTQSAVAARDEAIAPLAADLVRDPIVRAALGDDTQLDRIAVLLASHLYAHGLADRTAEIYVARVVADAREPYHQSTCFSPETPSRGIHRSVARGLVRGRAGHLGDAEPSPSPPTTSSEFLRLAPDLLWLQIYSVWTAVKREKPDSGNGSSMRGMRLEGSTIT